MTCRHSGLLKVWSCHTVTVQMGPSSALTAECETLAVGRGPAAQQQWEEAKLEKAALRSVSH